MPKFGLGVPCHNEGQNIGRLLKHFGELIRQGWRPARIVVVSDACTDGTHELVTRIGPSLGVPVRHLISSERRGKAAAVNRIMAELDDCEVVALVSGDVLPVGDCLVQLIRALDDGSIGVAACRPIPEGPAGNPAVEVSKLLWALHHRIALSNPKSTEITVFRNLGQRLNERTITDEAELEWLLSLRGYRVAYVPQAEVLINSPLSLSDYLRARVRVTAGHLDLGRRGRYYVATLGLGHRLRALCMLALEEPVSWPILGLAVVLETYVMFVARCLHWFGPGPNGVWRRIESSKRVLACRPPAKPNSECR